MVTTRSRARRAAANDGAAAGKQQADTTAAKNAPGPKAAAAPPAKSAPSFLSALFSLLWAMLNVLARTLFGVRSRRAAISGSAVFLVVFVVTHAFGNLTIFFGKDAFNGYGAKLHALGPLFTAIEVYTFAGFALHVCTGLWLTLSDGKLRLGARFSWAQARLVLSGAVVLAFLVLHILTFRFGPWYETTLAGGGAAVRDLYRLQREVFARPGMVAWYVGAVLVLGAHLLPVGLSQNTVRRTIPLGRLRAYPSQGTAILGSFLLSALQFRDRWGWQKTVRKPQGLGKYLGKAAQPAAAAIGNGMAVLVTAAFVACPLYTFMTQ